MTVNAITDTKKGRTGIAPTYLHTTPVTFVDCIKTNKRIFKFFSPSRRHTILVFFRTKRNGNIPTATPL